MKLIEEEFISSDKDGFNFLGKEEKKGEEPDKRYFHNSQNTFCNLK